MLPKPHDGGIVEVFFGGSFDGIVDFAGSGSCRQSDAKLISEVEGEAEKRLLTEFRIG